MVKNTDCPVSLESQMQKVWRWDSHLWICHGHAQWYLEADESGNHCSTGFVCELNEMWCSMYRGDVDEMCSVCSWHWIALYKCWVSSLFPTCIRGCSAFSFLYFWLFVLRRQAPVSSGKVPEISHWQYGLGFVELRVVKSLDAGNHWSFKGKSTKFMECPWITACHHSLPPSSREQE